MLTKTNGRGAPESEAVRQHAEDDRGAAAAGRLANQDRQQTSAQKSSRGTGVSGEAGGRRETDQKSRRERPK